MHDFDNLEPAKLRDPYSMKWNLFPEDVLPLWVADMDFPIAQEIKAALIKRLDYNVGYPHFNGDPRLIAAIARQQAEYGLTGLLQKNFLWTSSVVPALYACIQGLTEVGDEVITQTPVYPPFLSSARDHHRVVLENPMRIVDGTWTIDFEHLETLPTRKTKVLMLCNPQNPTGRVFLRSELERLADFAKRHELLIISDELHSMLRFEGEHIAIASISEDASDRTLTLTGPCKAFNTAGLGGGVILAHNTALLERIQKATKGLLGHPNALSMEMWRVGLEQSQSWLERVLEYLRANRDFLSQWLSEHLPEVECVPAEGTYLAWLNFNTFSFAADLYKILLEDAKVGLNDGPPYGMGNAGWLRINFATSRAILQEALERIERCIRARTD
ncbi:MAG: MalY/PatB family protein [Deinococcales bacterium]